MSDAAARTREDLRELARLTSDQQGAQRVAWTPLWKQARDWMRARLDELPLEVSTDAAGNVWATLRGRSPETLVLGSHLDSVPDGGWLDGALGVLAGLNVVRRLAAAGEPPALTVRLVDWADEEGARFGRSAFGSGAAAGSLDPAALRGLRDAQGIAIEQALAEHGVTLADVGDAREELREVVAYLELHIEQGPVLEQAGVPVGVATGTLGVARHAVTFHGQAAHAGATPMELRRDPLLSAARLGLAIREIACEEGGTGTTGRLDATPGVVTAVADSATLLVDQRHISPRGLAAIERAARAAADRIAGEEGTAVEWKALQAIEPVAFDPALVELAETVVTELTGSCRRLPSGPLHDATEIARAGIPTALLFVQSIGGLSHTKVEDSRSTDIDLGVRAFEELTARVLRERAAVGAAPGQA